MLSFLFSFSNSFNFTCSAPLVHAPDVKNGKLQKIFVLTRHGLRAPIDKLFQKPEDRGTWFCDRHESHSPKMRVSQYNGVKRRFRQVVNKKLSDFPPNCQSADILVEGMKQLHELGQSFRQYLIDDMEFLPENFDSSLVEFRATKFQRCQKSAQNFIDGFYPPIQPGEKLHLTIGSDNQEFLYPDPSTCKELKEYWPIFQNLSEYHKRSEIAKEKYKILYDYTNTSFDNENWLYWGDLFSAYFCSDNELPSIVTDDIFESAVDDNMFMIDKFYTGQKGVAASPLWREVFQQIDLFNNKKSKIKFHLYSAHDTTLVGVLSSVGYSDGLHPPYRSHLTIELWKVGKKDVVRIVYNGKEVEMNDIEKGKTTVELSVLKEKLSPYLNFCLP